MGSQLGIHYLGFKTKTKRAEPKLGRCGAGVAGATVGSTRGLIPNSGVLWPEFFGFLGSGDRKIPYDASLGLKMLITKSYTMVNIFTVGHVGV